MFRSLSYRFQALWQKLGLSDCCRSAQLCPLKNSIHLYRNSSLISFSLFQFLFHILLLPLLLQSEKYFTFIISGKWQFCERCHICKANEKSLLFAWKICQGILSLTLSENCKGCKKLKSGQRSLFPDQSSAEASDQGRGEEAAAFLKLFFRIP